MTRQISLVLIAATLFTLAGCGPKVGTVSGTVTYKGKNLQIGNVTFFGDDNRVVFTQIQEDGTYFTDAAPAGNTRVTVETPTVKVYKPVPGQPPVPDGILSPAYKRQGVPIPIRYSRAETSGLELQVKPGEQTFDIEIKD